MSQISLLRIANFLGIEEQEIKAAKINILRGPNGEGKTSVIEALEKTFTNKSRRTEVVRHGTDEAALYVELDDGLEVNRRIRSDKADYLKIRKADEGVPSTEKFLRDLVNGNIFRPLDWVNLSVKEQTKSLLSMLEIGWSKEDIINWFGELTDNIDYTEHILIILKAIETKYYNDRAEVNREIKELEARIKSIVDDLPPEYDGEEWKDVNVQEYYSKVKEAQDINKWISEAKSLQENYNSKVESIKATAEGEKSKIKLKYNEQRQDIKDIIDLSKNRIEKAKEYISSANEKVEIELSKLDNELEAEYHELLQRYAEKKDLKKREILSQAEEQKDLIGINENKIAAKEQELLGLDEKEALEKKAIDEKIEALIEKEKTRIGKASKYLEEHEEIDVEPLQEEANKVQEMVSYLREWNRISEIRDNQLAPKEQYSGLLTERINKARNLPGELLKTAKMPIEGISVDENGLVRINGTLIDGLSEGEKLELAINVAKAQCGELKVICIDKWEYLDKKSQGKLLSEMCNDDYQYFITEVYSTENGEIEVEKIG